MGLFRDLWRIREYIKDVNEDPEYIAELGSEMKKKEPPPSTWVRHCGAIIVADILGYLVIGAIPIDHVPEELLPYLCALLAPMAVAIGKN